MKILLTGASGSIGRFVNVGLVNHGHEVVTTSRSREVRGGRTETRYLDLRGQIEPSLVEGIDAVVHLAGLADRRSASSPSDFKRVNRDAAIELAHAAQVAGVSRFIFASTLLVHGETSDKPLTRTSLLNPSDAYAQSKVDVELALQSSDRFDPMNIDILRLANVRESKGDSLDTSAIAKRIVARLPVIPVPHPDNRRATASTAAVERAIDSALLRPLDSTCVIRLVADGESGFRNDITQASHMADRQRIQLPIPTQVWRVIDRALGLAHLPSVAGVYSDLRCAKVEASDPAHDLQ